MDKGGKRAAESILSVCISGLERVYAQWETYVNSSGPHRGGVASPLLRNLGIKKYFMLVSELRFFL